MKFERPLQDRELKLLDIELGRTNIRLSRQIKFLSVWTSLALIIGTIAYFKIDPNDTIVLVFTVASYLGIGFWIVVEQRVKQNRKRKSIAFLKSKNLVTVVQVHSERYFLLKEQDDEGVFYLFQLADNKVVSFGGQGFYENEKFPNNNFEIIEGRGIKNEVLILETYIYGEKIKPARIISGKEKWDLIGSAHYPDPSKLTVADGRIEDFIR
jgi:hypothetical protein